MLQPITWEKIKEEKGGIVFLKLLRNTKSSRKYQRANALVVTTVRHHAFQGTEDTTPGKGRRGVLNKDLGDALLSNLY